MSMFFNHLRTSEIPFMNTKIYPGLKIKANLFCIDRCFVYFYQENLNNESLHQFVGY